MGENGTYHKNQLVELYKLIYIPFKTKTHTWGCSLVSDENHPTMYKVLPLRSFILDHCKIKPNDSDGLQEVKVFLLGKYKEY